MLLQTHSPNFAPVRARLAMFCVALLLMLSGCGDSALFSPNAKGSARVAIRPYFSELISASSFAGEINRIRITVSREPEGTQLSQVVQDVNPNDASWALNIDVPPNVQLSVLVELVNVVNGNETVQFSGIIPLKVDGDSPPAPAPVPVFPGPPSNLDVASVSISPRDQSIFEGDQLQLTASAVPSTAIITWISASSSVATVDANGLVTARAPGNAIIAALAGPRSDNITLTVLARGARVDVTPATTTLTSLGADATYTGRVVDSRNATIAGIPLTWTIADPTIATQLSPGVFRARRNGTTTVTATGVQNGRTLTGTATLVVAQRATSVVLSPASATLPAVGAKQQFNAQAKDANGNDLTGVVFTWSSNNAAVATVDATGLVTAVKNGTAKIKVDAGGATAEADVTVQQTAASLTITPAQATLTAIHATVQLTAQVKDANGNLLPNFAVTWTSANNGIATVDANGLVTAQGDGPVIILAAAGNQHANAQVDVNRVATSVRINPTDPHLTAGTSTQFTGVATDANGFDIEGLTVTWSSNNSSVASVSSTGMVFAASAGEADISASSGGASASTHVTVTGVASGPPFITGDALVVSNSDRDNQYFISHMHTLMPGVTFTSVTNAAYLTPSNLSHYRVVLVFENGIFGAAAMGNALAQYVASGGNVIMATFFWQESTGSTAYSNSAGWGALEQYNPFGPPSREYRSVSLNPASIVTHPLTENIHAISLSSYPNGMSTRAGTTVVASWNDGAPAIAFRTFELGQRVVALAMFPAHEYYGGVTGDFYQAFANAFMWAGGGSTPASVASNAARPFVGRSAPSVITGPAVNNIPSGTSGGPAPAAATRVEKIYPRKEER